MKKLWFPISLVLLSVLMAMCSPRNKPNTPSDIGGDMPPSWEPTPLGAEEVATPEEQQPEEQSKTPDAAEEYEPPTTSRPQPPRHGSPDQELVDSLKSVKTKRKQ